MKPCLAHHICIVLTLFCLAGSAAGADVAETVDTVDTTAVVESDVAVEVLPEDTLTSDPVFTEISLRSDGIVARDTLGNRWIYDFSEDRFVPREREREGGFERNPSTPPVAERCTDLIRVTKFQSYVHVGYEEYVDGDIFATGRVIVRGWVQGDIQTFKQVLVTSSGQVDGDIRAPEIVVKDGGVVLGRQIISNIPGTDLPYSISTAGIWVVFAFFLFWLLLAFVSVSLVPKQMGRIQSCISQYRLKCFALGILLVLLMAPAMIVFAVTIVGIVVTILIPFAYVMAMSLGVITFGDSIAKLISLRFMGERHSVLMQAIIGVLMFSLLWFVVAFMLGSTNPVAYGFGVFFLVLAILVSLYPFCTGLGAVFLTRFGFRPYISYRDRRPESDDPAPAPPPIPKAPPAVAPPPHPKPPHHPGSSPLSSGND